MDKSPDAFRTISEAADELDLPQHVLRFWETRFLQIKPLKRGGGRRYYRPEDVQLLKGIRHLLYDQGFTIKGVQRILKDQGTRHVAAIGETGKIRPIAPAHAESESASAPFTGEDATVEGERREPELEPSPAPVPPAAEAMDKGNQLSIAETRTVPEVSEATRARLRSVLESLEACRTMLDRARGA